MKTVSVKLADIVIDGGTQQRAKIVQGIVSEYAESMRCGAKFPPVTLFFDGAQYWLADGFHRFHASREVETLDILAEVHQGTVRDAQLFSAGANATHGMRLTNDDKRMSVMVLLNDKEWAKWTDRDIAKHCKVTHPFVAKLRLQQGVKVESHVVTVTTNAPEPAPNGVGAEQQKEGKPQKLAEPVAKNQSDDKDEQIRELVTELEASHKQCVDLQSLVESLQKDDKDAQIKRWHTKFLQLEGRLQQSITAMNEAKKDATYATGYLAKIRKILKVETNAQIVVALQK